MARLAKEGILEYLDVTKEVEEMQIHINQKTRSFLRILNEGITPEDYRINKGCKTCEFNIPDQAKNGYKECWGALADTEPHIFDLYHGGSIGHYKNGFYLDELIAEGKANLFDINPERLKSSKGA